MSAYLQDLTLRLTGGISHLPIEVREKHTKYLKAAQREDGGFAGRMGDSDLYYTSFALRALAILEELDETTTQKACLLYTSPSPRDGLLSRMPSSA